MAGWIPFAIIVAVLASVPIAVIYGASEICDRLDRIAQLLVWQVEGDEENDPDGPDEGESWPEPRKAVVAFRRAA